MTKAATVKGEKQVTVKVPDALHERLTTEAEARGVSLHWLIARLLGESVERLKPADTFTLTNSTPKPALFSDVAAVEAVIETQP